MDIAHLRLLRLLGELGSLRAVARALYISPSAASQQLAQLQHAVGAPVARKEGRRMVLTAAGRELAAAAGEVLTALARAEEVAHRHAGSESGAVTVSTFHSAGPLLLAPAVRRLAHDGPRVSAIEGDVSQADFPSLVQHADLVIAQRPADSALWPAGISVTPLLEEPFDIALPRAHPLLDAEELTPELLADESWATAQEGFSPATLVEAIGRAIGRVPEVRHRVNDFTTVAALVRSGDVLGVLPRFTTAHLGIDGIALRSVRGIRQSRRVDLLARPEALQRGAVVQVRDLLVAIAAEVSDDHGGVRHRFDARHSQEW